MCRHSVGTAKDCESARYASLSFISFKKPGQKGVYYKVRFHVKKLNICIYFQNGHNP